MTNLRNYWGKKDFEIAILRELKKQIFNILSYIDVYDRNIVDYYLGLNCKAEDAVITLKRAM